MSRAITITSRIDNCGDCPFCVEYCSEDIDGEDEFYCGNPDTDGNTIPNILGDFPQDCPLEEFK